MENENETSVKSNELDRMSNCKQTIEMDNLLSSQSNNQNIKFTEQKADIQSEVFRPKMLLQVRIQERIRQELQKKKLQMNSQESLLEQKQNSMVEENQHNEKLTDDQSLQTIQNLIGQIIKKKNETAKQAIEEEPSYIINVQQPNLPRQCQPSCEMDQMMEQIINDIPQSQLENIFQKIDNSTDNVEDYSGRTKKISQNIVEIDDDQSILSKNQNQISIPVEEAHYNLKVASAIREFLPNYPLQNIICCLQKQINRAQVAQTAKRIVERNQRQNHYPSYEEPINMAKKMYNQKNNFPVARNPYVPPSPSPRMKLRHYQQKYTPSPFSETDNLFPVAQKQQNRKNIQAYRQSVTKSNSSKKNVAAQKPAPVQHLKNDERQSLERQIAHVFVTKGYGLTLTKQYTKQQIQGNRYNSLLTSVIRNGLRKLCEIMNKNLKQNVKNYDSAEERLLRSSLVNCRKWLSRTEQQTFYKIINISYGMSQQPIYQEEVTALYERIKKELSRRIVQQKGKKIKTDGPENGAEKIANTPISQNMPSKINPSSQSSRSKFLSPPQMMQRPNPGNQRMAKATQTFVQAKNQSFQNVSPVQYPPNKLQNIGEPAKNPSGSNLIKYEREIVAQYSNNKNVEQVFQYLTKKYRDIQWNKQEIIKTIQKLIKIGLKKILKFRKEFVPQSPNLPQLNLNETIVSGIIHAPAALETRVTVVKSLLENNLTLLRTVQLINAVNNCIQQLNGAGRKV